MAAKHRQPKLRTHFCGFSLVLSLALCCVSCAQAQCKADNRGNGDFLYDCIFPFFYEGVEYTGCTMAGWHTTWCMIKSPDDEDWGNCKDQSLACRGQEEEEEPSDPPPDDESETITYRPGLLNGYEVGLFLSQGLTAKIIAKSGDPVDFHNGGKSSIPFHGRPDFGATFKDTSQGNNGGWNYVINSEMKQSGKGGVGAITFDKNGNILNYKNLLSGTTMNCGGGRTPWDTWASCEECLPGEAGYRGQIYQVHPSGARKAEKMTMGLDGERFESFAYDDRDKKRPRFFATVDHPLGALRRWTPKRPKWKDPWSILHGEGDLDFLFLYPDNPSNTSMSGGKFEWVSDREEGKESARLYFPESEAIDRVDNMLYFVTKKRKVLYMLDLDAMTFTRQSTVHGVFEGSADQIQRILADDDGDQILYMTEERIGGTNGGIHGRNSEGHFFTILEGDKELYKSETTALAFSPGGHHMYFAFQNTGHVFDVTRKDGLPFHGRSLDVQYHNVN